MSIFDDIKSSCEFSARSLCESGWTHEARTSARDSAATYAAAVDLSVIPSSRTVMNSTGERDEVIEDAMAVRVITDDCDLVPVSLDRIKDPDGGSWIVGGIIDGNRASGTVRYQLRRESTVAAGLQRGRW